jgi:hypothetical protein
MVSRSNSDPLILRPLDPARASPSSAHLGRLRHPPGHRSSSASHIFRIKAWAFNVPDERPCLSLSGAWAPDFRCNPRAGSAPQLRQGCCPNSDHAKFFSIIQARESRRSHACPSGEEAGETPGFGAPDLKQTRRDPAQGPPDSAMKLVTGQRSKTLRGVRASHRSDGR